MVAALTTVIAVVLLVVGVVGVVTLRASVTTVVDKQLTGSMSVFSHSVDKYRDGSPVATPGVDPNYVKPLTAFGGQAPGTVIVLLDDGVVTDSAVFSDSDPVPLSSEAIAQIENKEWADNRRQDFDVAGLGDMRMESLAHDEDLTLVAGISLTAANEAVVRETVVLSILALAALVATVICTVLVVRVAFRPLSRVVATAKKVTDLPLGTGEAALTVRVADPDTDPRTEVGKVGEALNHLLSHVDDALAVRVAADRRMKQFVTDASHELRTPLAAIQGYAELTRQDSDQLPEMTEYALARIESEAKRMGALVADLLLLARLDEGQDLHTTCVDLADLLVNAVNDARVSAPLHHWAVVVPESAVMVNGDNERLHQLVANLLSNARVHTPPGTAVVATLTTMTDDRDVVTAELTITDNGPGIAPDLLKTLFQRFVRGDKARSRETDSTGLGLAIVSSIVDAHHGQASVESTQAGTTFRVRIPAIEPSGTATVTHQRLRTSAVTQLTGR
ncbi:putative two-component histidine kinase [Rhodococcus wratislaviensis NBRC 100605]|uniref:histidine kinase n=1 Tax=Rhodococcus wratislaviensis NBRC 100605 TaxID=1219028 RepID=X0PNR8_RHOWR|nr:putative two-component histidine kinase [Rhodococcus wratislaviensis NBRC 100605]